MINKTEICPKCGSLMDWNMYHSKHICTSCCYSEKIVHKNEDYIEQIAHYYDKEIMIDELEDSAVKLAKSERESAWREMAKQVAHEIKNPLTPMRLTIQSFQKKFNIENKNINIKVDEFSKSLIQQIDVMSSIAGAFSDFAKMPEQKKELLNLNELIETALDIFDNQFINFSWCCSARISVGAINAT